MSEPIVLFGAGSAVIVEVEESCRRLGRPVAAIVQNTADPTWAQDPSLVVPLDELDGGLFEYDVLVPLFRPANRRTAVARVHAPALGGSVPRHVALQCAQHRDGRALGGFAGPHGERRKLRFPCRC